MANAAPRIHIGCAGWSLPREHWPRFPAEGSHLQRYAARLPAVEIDSSFYRPHRPATYARWAASVPEDFRFAVKLPRTVTHDARLDGVEALLDAFVEQVSALGPRLGCLLAQLPPSLAWNEAVATGFVAALRARTDAPLAIEPRHRSWFESSPDALLAAHGVARVAADPPRAAADGQPGGWRGLRYWRLHGSPEIYRSTYDDRRLAVAAEDLADAASEGAQSWCVFDNTALGAATANALDLAELLGDRLACY